LVAAAAAEALAQHQRWRSCGDTIFNSIHAAGAELDLLVKAIKPQALAVLAALERQHSE